MHVGGRAIPLEFRELFADAVEITTQCVHCIDAHGRLAFTFGEAEHSH